MDGDVHAPYSHNSGDPMVNPAQQEMKALHHLTPDDLAWLDDAVGYDNVSTIGAAYARLVEIRDSIQAGGIVSIGSLPELSFSSTESFDHWVRSRYPGFTDDHLHPVFMGTAP